MDVFGRKMSNWNVLSVETALQQLNTFEEDSKDFITRSNTVNYQGISHHNYTFNKQTHYYIYHYIDTHTFIFVIIVKKKKIAKCQNNVLKMDSTFFYMILLECSH